MAVDSIEAALIVLDPTENCVHQFNDAALKLTALSGYQLGNMKASSLFPNQLAELTGFTLGCLALRGAWSSDFSIACADGMTRPVEIFASTFHAGERRFVVLACFDLRATQARRAEGRGGSVLSQRPAAGKVRRRLPPTRARQPAHPQRRRGRDLRGQRPTALLRSSTPRPSVCSGGVLTADLGRLAHAPPVHHSREDGSTYPTKACPIYAAFRDGRVRRVDNEVFWRKDGACFPVEYTSTPI